MANPKGSLHSANFKDLVGYPPFDYWIVIRFAGVRGEFAYWWCRCKCGTERAVKGNSLLTGHSKSCGCRRLKIVKAALTTHGMSKTPEFRAWQHMLDRCFNVNHQRYKDWGGRGITVCDRWLESFENFYADMGPRPSSKHSLDRYPDNDGNYEPGNCRWATRKEQQCNTRWHHA